MSTRPPVLRQDLVDRLRALATGAGGNRSTLAALRERGLGVVGRPLRKVVMRLVDPSLQATLDQLRREAALPVASPAQPEVEVLRAELASTHAALTELARRVDEIERTRP